MSNKELTESDIVDYAKSLSFCAQQDNRLRQRIEAWEGLSEEQKAVVIEIITDLKRPEANAHGPG